MTRIGCKDRVAAALLLVDHLDEDEIRKVLKGRCNKLFNAGK